MTSESTEEPQQRAETSRSSSSGRCSSRRIDADRDRRVDEVLGRHVGATREPSKGCDRIDGNVWVGEERVYGNGRTAWERWVGLIGGQTGRTVLCAGVLARVSERVRE
jgi:hypothetical protein